MLKITTKSFNNKSLFLITVAASSVTVFTLLYMAWINMNKRGFSVPQWQVAGEIIPKSLQKKYANDFLDNSPTLDSFYHQVKAVEIRINQTHLYIINNSASNNLSSPLCGTKGCLVTAYINNDGEWLQVLNGYFQPFSLTDKPNLKLQNNFSNLPCVNITEIENTRTYCYDNQEKKYFLR